MEVERLEVLRGPQGTLFGRNPTAGAINVVTRNPTGDMAFTQMVGVGNEGQLRTKTTIDTPSFGPFSAYVTYIHYVERLQKDATSPAAHAAAGEEHAH